MIKISRLVIKNMFSIKEFDSDGKSMELDGKNGVGKSAVIDAVKYALTNKSDREFVIRQGETEGEVILELTNGTRIHRKARTNKADYKSIRETENGPEKTESFLRTIFTPLQLDPVAFSGMTSEEQNRIILDLIDFKWDLKWIEQQFGEIPPKVNYDQNILRVLHEIQSDKGHYFMHREDVNRDVRNKTAFIQEIGATLPPNYDAKKWEAANLGDLYSKIETIRNNNDRITEAKNIIEGRATKMQSYDNWLEKENQRLNNAESQTLHEIQDEITALQNAIEKAKARIIENQKTYTALHENAKLQYDKEVAALNGETKQAEELAKQTIADFAELQEEANTTEAMKAHINEYNRMVGLQEDIIKLKAESQDLTDKIEKARTLPGEILEQCKIPIAGLTIKDGTPLIKGLPISNLSEGEKMDLCIDVTVAKEGNLKMILIDGIERLATDRRDSVYAKLKDKGVQFIATRTTDDENLTVIEL